MTDDSKKFTEETRKPEKPKVVQSYGECSEILDKSRESILKKFEDEVRKKVPAAFDKNSGAIIDHLPGFLDRVIESLRRGSEVSAACADTDICRVHGAERADLPPYTIEQVLFEYTILRRIILDVLREKTTVTAAESDVIYESFQEGMLQAASEFAKTQAAEIARVNESLRKSEELQVQIFASSEDCYKILDSEGKLLVLTEHSRKHLEIDDVSPLIGKSWIMFWQRPEDIEAAKQAVKEAALGGKGHFVGYYPTRSKKRLWWDVVITPIKSANGEVKRLLAISRDVTSIRKADEEKQARLAELRIIIESIPEAVYIGNENGIYEANKIALDQLGFSSVEEMNRNIAELSKIIQNRDPETGEELPPEKLSFSRALKGERAVQVTDVVHLKTGEHRVIRGSAAPIIIDGKIKGAVAVNTDITEARKAQETLSSKNKELDRFAAIAAHDLKSPLNSMTQFTELLAEQYSGRLDSHADEYINFIIAAGKRMRDLIDNLLEFSRAGTIDKDKLSPIDINEILSTVETNLLTDIERTEAQIVASENLPTVSGNKFQMVQLFQNLIANAIKFRKPHSAPRIDIDFKEAGNCWKFSVADHGIGMDRSKSHKIFEIFHKAHGHHYEGSGIGLAVCKRIVEAHGGQIDFESFPGKGSVFIFTLPKHADIRC